MVRYRRISLRSVPVIIATAFPKSGTHLLIQVLQGFSRLGPAVDSGLPAMVTFAGDTGRRRSEREILADLRRLLPGDIAFGHLHATPALVSFFTQQGVAAYFIIRDPRDVVVSHVHYITEMATDHVHHPYYTETLKTDGERLRVSILGRPEWNDLFPDVYTRFKSYLGWLGQAEVLTLRFEDFLADRVATIGKIVDHAVRRGFSLDVSPSIAVEILTQNIQPERSPTFHRGQAGGWRECFTSEHKQLFKQVTGDLIVRLGYEKNNEW